MTSKIVFRDRRLKGEMSVSDAAHAFELDENVSLVPALMFVETKANLNGGKVDRLLIRCHGDDAYLQLGREGVQYDTLGRWKVIKNRVKDIILYSCSVAQVDEGKAGSWRDGRRFGCKFAEVTGANVYAGNDVQWYSHKQLNFKNWEGDLLRFSPDGNVMRMPNILF